MTLRELGDLLIYVGAIAGALGAIWWLMRKVVVQPLKKWITTQVQAVGKKVDDVHHEVTPNHGKSAHDALMRAIRQERDIAIGQHVRDYHD